MKYRRGQIRRELRDKSPEWMEQQVSRAGILKFISVEELLDFEPGMTTYEASGYFHTPDGAERNVYSFGASYAEAYDGLIREALIDYMVCEGRQSTLELVVHQREAA